MAPHARDGGLVMPNAWDGPSALMPADAGFEAIATSSAALAATLGRSDGRHEVTRGEHLGHARLIGRLTGCPSTEPSGTATAMRLKTPLP
ncbi:isocitrate lyase/phosphoenolpyruvate mutase family protein [Streptomyces sp.]|uniref:isocitrate lyase/phosphoenolpyruvate mutase family protein n=1 Tax=Streptomyces sp. TaxID=1931 RepID=UPI0025DC93F4|nr:isocitrate lyase/phosphoenolpyruvate mutase family protein [Streptomyces sp.]